jgi:biotin transport system substrate-specific component
MTAATFGVQRRVLADLIPGARVRDASLVMLGAGLTGIAAQVSIQTSLSPVPFTLQTLAVLLVGASLGAARGALSMLVYLLAGAVGVPWYADHASGWGGGSYGYVVGFVVAAALVGFLAERRGDRTVGRTIALMVLGNFAVYAVGATWLAMYLHLGAGSAFRLGVRPFLASDVLKIVVAAGLLPGTWRMLGSRSGEHRRSV